MSDDRPNGPENVTGSPVGDSLGNLPNSDDPRGVGVGFPSGAVELLREEGWKVDAWRDDLGAALTEVVAWVDRFATRMISGRETLFGTDGPVVGKMRELRFEGDDPVLDQLDLVRVNGRAFVPETPAIVDDGDPHDLAFRLGELVGAVEAGGMTKDELADDVIEIVRQLVEGPVDRCRICGCTEDRACSIVTPGSDVGAAAPGFYGSRPCGWADETRTLCDAPNCLAAAGRCPEPGCIREDPDHARAVAGDMGQGSREQSFRAVDLAGEVTVDGLFPGDIGYRRPQ